MFGMFADMEDMFNTFCAQSDEFIAKQKERLKNEEEQQEKRRLDNDYRTISAA